MAQRLPPELEHELSKFEGLRRDNEALQMAVQSMQSELTELSVTLEELRKQPDDTVTYRTVGSIMFKIDKTKLVAELEDREKTLQVQLASYGRRLKTSSEKVKELEDKIQMELAKQNLRLQ